jgi:hypothetical protein
MNDLVIHQNFCAINHGPNELYLLRAMLAVPTPPPPPPDAGMTISWRWTVFGLLMFLMCCILASDVVSIGPMLWPEAQSREEIVETIAEPLSTQTTTRETSKKMPSLPQIATTKAISTSTIPTTHSRTKMPQPLDTTSSPPQTTIVYNSNKTSSGRESLFGVLHYTDRLGRINNFELAWKERLKNVLVLVFDNVIQEQHISNQGGF